MHKIKHLVLFVHLFFPCLAIAQADEEFTNLVALAELYTTNVNATGDDFVNQIEKLRTPGLNHIIDALIAVGKADEILLTKAFLTKPPQQELMYWYVLREVHYNNQSKKMPSKPNATVAKETLAMNIDTRWLLDNYYYRIRGGIAKMFNEKDLSTYNFDLDDYGLENDTEKAILYFAITNSLIQRFRVLNMLKKSERLLEFAQKLPSFNGLPYYEYIAFNFDDFEWIGYDETKSYKKEHLNELYQSLNAHFSALAEKNQTSQMRHLYFNSILYQPLCFKYAGALEKDLKALYKESKKIK